MKRSAKVTPTGVRFLLLALAVGLAAVNTGNNILYLLFAMMLSLIVVTGLFSERVLARLSAVRSLPPRLFAGTPTRYQIALTNGKRYMPAFSLRVREGRGALRLDVPEHRCTRIDPNGTVTIDSVATFLDRGAHHLPGIEITTTFPFGLFEKTLRIPVEAEPLVYPAIGSLRRPSGRPSGEEGPTGPWRGTAGLSHLREYQVGDDPRFIHWKHSARRAKLVVREPEREGARSLVLVFSNRLPPDPLPIHSDWFEDAVRLTASLADRAIRDGWDVLLATWDGTSRIGRGASHLERLLRTLATIGPTPRSIGDRLVAWAGELHHQALHLVLVWDDPRWSSVRARCERVWVAAQHRTEAAP
jgi:uncharacterized protein (DUF58 family)